MKSVKIGNREWMQENLAVDDGGEGIHYNPENKQYYYTWDAAMRIAEAIPGWHLPTADEWVQVTTACGAKIKDNTWIRYRYLREYIDVLKLFNSLRILFCGSFYDGTYYDIYTCAFFLDYEAR